MTLYYCGFNGFKQIPNQDKIVPKLTLVDLKSISKCSQFSSVDIYMQWSYNIFKIDSMLFKAGYCLKQNKCTHEDIQSNKLEDPKDIICDENHIILLRNDGSLFKYRDQNDIRIDGLTNVEHEVSENASSDNKVTYISGGRNFTALTTLNGDFFVLPSKIYNFQETIAFLSCGFEHSLILTTQGNIYSWGSGRHGQLGHGELSNEEIPRLIEALAGIKISSISTGAWHSCAVSDTGDLYTWGWNEKGQLGFPTLNYSNQSVTDGTKQINTPEDIYNVLALPKLINFKDEQFEVVEISCGNAHTVIYGNDGKLYGTGWNQYKQICPEDMEVIQQFHEIETDFTLEKDFKLKCGPWSTVVIINGPNL